MGNFFGPEENNNNYGKMTCGKNGQRFHSVFTYVYIYAAFTLTLQYIATRCTTTQKRAHSLHIKNRDILGQPM
jgi:hypothetical protein